MDVGEDVAAGFLSYPAPSMAEICVGRMWVPYEGGRFGFPYLQYPN